MTLETIAASEIEVLTTLRQRVQELSGKISEDKFFQIPTGFNNSIAWNVGHIFVTQQLLCYKLSGLPMQVTDELADMLKKGSSPADWTRPLSREELTEPLVSLAAQFQEDYHSGRFKEFTPYTTSAGIELKSLKMAFSFNLFHEGLHLGYIMAQLRSL